MVKSTPPQLSVHRQCQLLAVNRNRIPAGDSSKAPCFSEKEERMIRRMDEWYWDDLK
jgi:hypothetical protein